MAFNKTLTLAGIQPPLGKWLVQGRTFLLKETAEARKAELDGYNLAAQQRKAQIDAMVKKGKLPIPKWPSIDHFLLQKADAEAKRQARRAPKGAAKKAVAA